MDELQKVLAAAEAAWKAPEGGPMPDKSELLAILMKVKELDHSIAQSQSSPHPAAIAGGLPALDAGSPIGQ